MKMLVRCRGGEELMYCTNSPILLPCDFERSFIAWRRRSEKCELTHTCFRLEQFAEGVTLCPVSTCVL